MKRSRLIAFLVWFAAFWVPPYTEKTGWDYERVMEIVQLVTSQAVIYELVRMVWPSLLLHIAAYYLLYKILRGESRAFVAFAGLLYVAIAFGQGIAFTKYGFSILVSNVFAMAFAGLLWLRDYKDRIALKGKGPSWFIPLSLFAFISPDIKPLLEGGNFALSLILNALAGSGVVAYCLFTPIALTAAGRAGALRPFTLRLTSIFGLFYSLVVVGSALAYASAGGPAAIAALWSAALHAPLLVTCLYYFAVPYGEK